MGIGVRPAAVRERRACVVLCFVGVVGFAGLAFAQPAGLAPGPQLLVDDYLIERCDGLVRTTHRPRKSPGPILVGQEWYQQALFHLKVVHDPALERFRMWFVATRKTVTGRGYFAYAESDDGIRWRQPNLGLVEVDGSTDNNAVKAGAYCLMLVDHGPGCAEPDKRYVLVHLGGRESTFVASYSADGLRFTDHPDNPVFKADKETMGDRLSGCWDSLAGRYLVTVGYRGKPENGYRGRPRYYKEGYRRLVGQATSKDLAQWTPLRRIIATDPEEPGFEEFYGMKPTVRGGLYLGFLRILRDDMAATPDGPADGIGWTELCTSRDGENWVRHPGVFLDRDHKPGTWDHAMAWIGDCITAGDQEYIYYGGYEKGHKVGKRTLGVATLRKDGFVSRDAGPEGGSLRTRLFVLKGKRLTVNAKVDGELRVRVLDPSGLPIRGLFRKDCTPIRGDSVSHNVRFKGSLAPHQGKPVRLEFTLRDAQLYGFELLP